jgi:hypothetical protein
MGLNGKRSEKNTGKRYGDMPPNKLSLETRPRHQKCNPTEPKKEKRKQEKGFCQVQQMYTWKIATLKKYSDPYNYCSIGNKTKNKNYIYGNCVGGGRNKSAIW